MDTHELNKLLAEFMGMHLFERHGLVYYSVRGVKGPIEGVFDPCHDHNQMAMVEEQFRKQSIYHIVKWNTVMAEPKVYTVYLFTHQNLSGWVVQHESKLMALALAVQAMLKEGVQMGSSHASREKSITH